MKEEFPLIDRSLEKVYFRVCHIVKNLSNSVKRRPDFLRALCLAQRMNNLLSNHPEVIKLLFFADIFILVLLGITHIYTLTLYAPTTSNFAVDDHLDLNPAGDAD
jgi:hypothetical protein